MSSGLLIHEPLGRFGGSGGFADPEHDLALAMVCNRGQGTPIGDLRILRLSQATARAVQSLG